MALNLDAILRVRAQTAGQQDVRALEAELRRLGLAGDDASQRLKNLASSGTALQRAFGLLGFAAVVAGLTAYGRQALDAGEASQLLVLRVNALAKANREVAQVQAFSKRAAEEFTMGQQEAGEAVADLYGRLRPMGISLQQIETAFVGVSKTTRLAGLSAFDAKEAFRQLGQAMGSGRLQGDELRSIMERMPAVGQAIVEVFNDISRSRGLVQITRERSNQLVAEVKDGEKRQTKALQDEIAERQRAIQGETEKTLRDIARRYDEIRRIQGLAVEDRVDTEDRARQDAMDAEQKDIDQRYEMERKKFEDWQELERKKIDNDTTLSDQQRELMIKNQQELKEQVLQEIRDRQDAELKQLNRGYEDQAKAARRAREEQQNQLSMELQDLQRKDEDAVRESAQRKAQAEKEALEQAIANEKEASKKAIVDIMLRTKVTVGDIKKMGAEGLITTDIMLKALEKLSKQKIPPPTALMEFNKALKDLQTVIGEQLLPILTPMIKKITELIKTIIGAPAGVKMLAVGVAVLVSALIVLYGALLGLAVLVAGAKFIGITLGFVRLIKLMRDLAGASKLAKDAIQTVTVRDITNPALPPGGPRLPPAGPVAPRLLPPATPPIKPPPANLFKGFLGELAVVGRALAGLTKQVGAFFLKFVVESGLAIPAIGRIGTAFASLRIGATIAGWLSVLTQFPALAIAALQPFLAWVTGVMLPTLVGIFSGPVGWIALAVIALIAAAIIWREPLMKFFSGIITYLQEEWIKLWENIWKVEFLLSIAEAIIEWNNPILKFFNAILEFIDKDWKKNLGKRWDDIGKGIGKFVESMKKVFVDAFNYVSDIISGLPGKISGMWSSLINGIGGMWNGMIRQSTVLLNQIIRAWNETANKANQVAGSLRIPIRLPTISEFASVPAAQKFAKGGWMNKPTLGLLAEAGDPKGEYAIPGSRMDAAMAGWAQGLRGQQLVRAWQTSPSMGQQAAAGPAPAPGSFSAAPVVNLNIQQTGPVMQTPDGSQWVRRDEALALAKSSSQATLAAVAQMLGTGAARSRYGLR